MHPGVLILVWLGGVASLQLLPFGALLVVVGVLLILALALAGPPCLRLLRRIRFLLLAIVVLFAGFTPGEAMIPDLPHLSPSWEGAVLAMEHAGRVLAVVCCVALLLRALPPQQLVGGMHALLRPFDFLGVSAADRIAVRTLLVLEYVQNASVRDWQEWLREGRNPSEAAQIQVARQALRWWDIVALLTGFLLLVALGVKW
ncbi:MAG: hypothetical protein KJZ96_04530 [Rhodocyclaceae bacterium]|jgi:energy-coupling factor transporter transmembrane protein EcfT|nr:hypothetical protein [Rhodocyclaceae bacterium]